MEYLGKKGPISALSSKLGELSIKKKKTFGKALNDIKNEASKLIEEKKDVIEKSELNKKLNKETIDITLPATNIPVGSPSILEHVVEDIEEFFMSMGYDVVDGPEIEEDKYNFEL